MVCHTGKFSLFEQLWMQLSFNGVWILGAIAMFWASPLLSIGYFLLFPAFGIVFCVMHLWTCPRCPHIKEHGSCVQLPPSLTKRIIKKNVTGPLTAAEKIGTYLVLYGTALVPVYWVVQTRVLLVPYLVVTLMHYSAYHLHFCKRCLNVRCPQNRNRCARRTFVEAQELAAPAAKQRALP